MSAPQPYEIYAIRYAHHQRMSPDNFIGGDPHNVPMPLDYFVWAIVGDKRTFILDTGFDAEMAKKRQREFLRSPGDGLKLIGVDPVQVQDVIISHMHYDHAGNHDLFPNARYHIQDREMQYCTGRCMSHKSMRYPFEREDVYSMVDKLFQGRVQFHDGDDEIAPGLSVHHVGGHTMGLQFARVWTKRGWMVLASDASHFYANMNDGRPFPIVYNVGEMLDGHKRLHALAESPDHVIPGHDPLVTKRFPAPKSELQGAVVRLDAEPAPMPKA